MSTTDQTTKTRTGHTRPGDRAAAATVAAAVLAVLAIAVGLAITLNLAEPYRTQLLPAEPYLAVAALLLTVLTAWLRIVTISRRRGRARLARPIPPSARPPGVHRTDRTVAAVPRRPSPRPRQARPE
jgi:hypothetical protein